MFPFNSNICFQQLILIVWIDYLIDTNENTLHMIFSIQWKWKLILFKVVSQNFDAEFWNRFGIPPLFIFWPIISECESFLVLHMILRRILERIPTLDIPMCHHCFYWFHRSLQLLHMHQTLDALKQIYNCNFFTRTKNDRTCSK